MKKSTKALLLSAFLCPGAGHFYLKKYIRGSVLTGAFISALVVLIGDVINITNQVTAQLTEQINAGNIALDLTELTASITEKLQGFEAPYLTQISYLLMILWIVSVVDSYRVGRRIEQYDDRELLQ
ncbi:DUF6677 family protein [Psychromonas ossibalaenae]|uniref:DUF6677 family protein n=1 Tax=Psychromonas ossibalaenae TaxID=444922 RepID=UPI00037F04AE|nr:DUF6677 family protein [Psychromonas ossibalaenae]